MLDCDKVKLNASQRILQILFDARSIIAANHKRKSKASQIQNFDLYKQDKTNYLLLFMKKEMLELFFMDNFCYFRIVHVVNNADALPLLFKFCSRIVDSDWSIGKNNSWRQIMSNKGSYSYQTTSVTDGAKNNTCRKCTLLMDMLKW